MAIEFLETPLGLFAEILTIVIAGFTIALAALRPIGKVRRMFLSVPLRRVLRNPRRWGLDRRKVQEFLGCGRGQHSSSCRSDRMRFIRILQADVTQVLDGQNLLPADVVASLNARLAQSAVSSLPAQSIDERAFELMSILRAAATSRAQSLWARVLYPQDVARQSELYSAISRHLEDFAMSSLAEPVVAPSTRTPFAEFASALSGAVVLADSVDWRSRYAAKVLTWHERSFRHAGAADGDATPSYASLHARGDDCKLGASIPDRMIGDFDRRVLDLKSVSPIASSEFGWTGFLIETSETCYLTTEQGEGAVWLTSRAEDYAAPVHRSIGCKHLVPRSGDEQSPHVRADGGVLRLRRDDADPVVLMTTYVSVLTADRKLALVRRSGKVRHGKSVISATAGGVVEPDSEGARGDVDPSGMPSFVDCARREAMEEIGLDIPPQQMRPVCVFLSNIRSRWLAPDAGRDKGRAGLGQTVGVVLFFTHTHLTVEELKAGISKADPALGGFEVDRFETIDVASDPVDPRAAKALAVYAADHSDDLDQHGLLSCLYAAALIDGPDKAREAFSESFADKPWWANCDDEQLVRVVRDPRKLFDQPSAGAQARSWETAGPESWVDSWRSLPDRLDQARRVMSPNIDASAETGEQQGT